ncbi:hypothetical protein H0H93_010974 [Arthromyces matolae]|nr:hypothetical protein H0H93_010974 [Arthromyces matolae]
MFLNPGQGSSSVQTRKNPSLKVEASSDLCNGKNYPFINEKLPDHHPSSSSMLPFSGPDSFYDQQACNEPHAPCALLSTSYPSCIPSTASYDHEKSQVGAGANFHFSRDLQSSQENLPSRDTHYEQLPNVHHGQAWPSGSLQPDLIPSTTGSAAIARLEPSVLHNASSAAPSKRKSRREKPRIELAPDQPPTTQGKPRARVYVACVQCRARKIRCDGAKPVCYNCSKRVNGGSECNYDAIPKRRGPDKTPGARQRAAKDAKDIYSISEVGPARRGRRPDTASRSTTSPESQPSPDPLPLNKSLPDPHSTHNPLPLSSPGSDILPTPVDAVLSLTFVDADNPKATKFSPGAVPTVLESSRNDWLFARDDFNPYLPSNNNSTNNQSQPEDPRELGCSCSSMTLISHWQESSELTPLWTLTPAWNNSWNEAEVRKESCRRLCWSSAILAAGHTSYTTAHKTGILKLFISDPANYALLFDGESIAHSPACSSRHSSKDTVWALHDRSFLLWHSCTRMRNDLRASEDMKAHFAIKAWLEADTLEAALNKHTCRIERQFIFQAREYIFNTRMCISYEFQRYIPLVSANVNGLFHRRKAEEWRKELLSSEIYGSFENVALSLWIVTHQATVAERFMSGLHTITGNSKNILARRPFYVFWFMGQISRALGLWECDHTLTVAMDVCKAFLPALDYLSALWPCPEQRYRYEKLRERLANACYLAGVNPPPPPNLTIPSSSPSFAM